MQLVYKLTKEDIRNIIAEKFDIRADKVHLECFLDTVGYGLAESEVPNVRAEVEVNQKV